MAIELIIATEQGSKLIEPLVVEPIEWSTERRSTPGKLAFDVIADSSTQFEEGDAVRFKQNGENVFYGFIFKKNRSKENIISVTAYDQLRYLQNKDTYVYEGKTAAEFIKMVAADFSLNIGDIEDTGYKIASRVEENTSLFDMIENALDLTLENRKEMYVLYDDFGKLTLKNIANMKIKSGDSYFMVDESSGEDFDYSSSIDDNTYNKIKLTYENEETSKREVYITQDSSHINQWGILQYYETLTKGENGQAKADALLKLYNQKTRNLKLKGIFGDVRVRAGSLIIVNLNLGDISVKNFMMVEKVTHKFSLDEHTMDITVRGGEFVG